MYFLLVARKYSSNKAAVVVGIDMTEKKMSEEKIREQAALLDKTTDAILVQDSKNQIVYCNGGAETLFDRSFSALSKRGLEEFIHGEDLLGYEKAVAVLKDKGEWSGELRIQTHSGAVKTTYSRWTRMNSEKRNGNSILNAFYQHYGKKTT